MANKVTMPVTRYRVIAKHPYYEDGCYHTRESPAVYITSLGAIKRDDVRAALEQIGEKLRRTDRFEAVPIEKSWYTQSAETFVKNGTCIRTEKLDYVK